VNFRWTLRIAAGITFVMLSVATLLAKEFVQDPNPREKRRNLIDFSILMRKKVFALMLMGFFTTFGYFAPFFYLPAYTTFIGLTTNDAAIFIALMSGINAGARIIIGYSADRVGRINILFLATAMSSVACLLVWPFAKNYGMLLTFVIIYGVSGGGFISIFPAVCAEIVEPSELSNTMGIVYTFFVFGNVLGPAICGALLDSTLPNTNFLPGMIYCGATAMVGALLVLWLRSMITKKVFLVV